MRDDVLVVFYEGSVLVVIEVTQAYSPERVLDEYARIYAFDRLKLRGVRVDKITHHPEH